jgi:preprotein translocase subunit SecF
MSKLKDLGNDLYSGKKSIDVVGRRKIFYIIGIAVVIASILVPIVKGGFNFGIEFRGGSEFRIDGLRNCRMRLLHGHLCRR